MNQDDILALIYFRTGRAHLRFLAGFLVPLPREVAAISKFNLRSWTEFTVRTEIKGLFSVYLSFLTSNSVTNLDHLFNFHIRASTSGVWEIGRIKIFNPVAPHFPIDFHLEIAVLGDFRLQRHVELSVRCLKILSYDINWFPMSYFPPMKKLECVDYFCISCVHFYSIVRFLNWIL